MTQTRLFTSNFKALFISSFLILVLLYSALITSLPVGGDGIVQSERNMIRFQRFLYNPHHYERILVGSSMTFRLNMNSVSDKYCNLAVAAGGALTGLEAIIESGSLPKVVIIEANNTLMTGNDKNFIGQIVNRYSFLFETFPILQTQNKPTLLIYDLLKKKFESKALDDTGATPAMLANALKDRQEEPDLRLFNKRLAELKQMVDHLSRKGVRVVFFEPPTDPVIANSVSSTSIRKTLIDYFPKDKYTWLPFPENKSYHTTDGIHLTERSAQDFSVELNKQLNDLLGN